MNPHNNTPDLGSIIMPDALSLHERLVGHRGYPRRYPENTLISLQQAVAAGARLIEFDIQLSADGIPIVCHDDNLQRIAGEDISVMEAPFSSYAHLGVGEASRFGQAFADITLSTLDEVVAALAQWPQVRAFVELKIESLQHFGRSQVVAKVVDALQPVAPQCVLISDDLEALTLLREQQPETEIGWIIHAWEEPARQMAERHQPQWLICNYRYVPAPPEPLWPGPWNWLLYEISDIDLARSWFARGADYIESNDIGAMLAALEPQE